MKRNVLNKQTVLQGTLILTVGWLVIRILGAVYKIPLGRMLGGEGLGIYAVPNQFYMLFYTISAAGIPVAMASIVSEKIALGHYKDALRVFRITRAAMVLVGFVFALVLFNGAGWLIKSGLVPNPDAYLGLRAIAPVIFFAAITSAYRGLFQGFQNMRVVAYSQVADQVVMVTATVLFSYLLLPQGLAIAAAGANLGAVPGAAAATLLLVLYYRRQRRDLTVFAHDDVSGAREGTLSLLKRIIFTAVPVSIASIAITVTAIIDHKLIVDRLQLVGYTQREAVALFGQFNQMAMSFVAIATAFAQSLKASLVPAASEALALNQPERVMNQVSQAVRLVIILTLPAAAGLYLLAHQLTLLIFAEEAAGVPLASLALVVVFWSVHLVTSGTLQGMGKAGLPVRNLVIGIAIKLAMTYYLTPTSLGIRAAALGNVVIFTVSSVLNIIYIARSVGFNFNLSQTLLRSGLATLVMSAVVLAVYQGGVQIMGGNSWPTLLAVLAGMMVYPVVLIALRGVGAEDVRRLPGIGPRIARLLDRIGRG